MKVFIKSDLIEMFLWSSSKGTFSSDKYKCCHDHHKDIKRMSGSLAVNHFICLEDGHPHNDPLINLDCHLIKIINLDCHWIKIR